MFYGKMPQHMPVEFGEALTRFWELMYFRSKWLTGYTRELSELVDQERYAEAFMYAMQYDMQRQTVREEMDEDERRAQDERRRAEAERRAAMTEEERHAQNVADAARLTEVIEQQRQTPGWRDEA